MVQKIDNLVPQLTISEIECEGDHPPLLHRTDAAIGVLASNVRRGHFVVTPNSNMFNVGVSSTITPHNCRRNNMFNLQLGASSKNHAVSSQKKPTKVMERSEAIAGAA